MWSGRWKGFLGFLGFNAFKTGNYLWLLWFLWFYHFKYFKEDEKRNIKMRSIEMKKYVTVITLILVLCGIYLLIGYNEYNSNTVSYKVESCEIEFPRFKGSLVNYNEQNKTLSARIWVNCCGVEIKVEKASSTYKIFEKQVGELCRCMCKRKVTIFNVSKEARIEFLDKDGNRYILSPNLKFCGWSTYGKCGSDEDCLRDGCSKQICRSRFDEPIITTCEWLDCYNADKFGVACKCIDGRCQWTRER